MKVPKVDGMIKEIQILSSLEIDILKAYKSVKGVEEGNFYTIFENAKELYENNSDYKQIVDDWEELQKEILPKVLYLYKKTLALRSELSLKNKNDLR